MSAESEAREAMITRIAEALEIPRDVVAAAARGESVVERSQRRADEMAQIAEQAQMAVRRRIDFEILAGRPPRVERTES